FCLYFVLFFFQAEDGIRDRNVTGVQTCALPIFEIYIEREKEFALVGSIYKGKVTRVLPGMQSAFVDIGLDGDAFLYVSDVFENRSEERRVGKECRSRWWRDE